MPKDINNAQILTINKRIITGFNVLTFPDAQRALLIESASGYNDEDGDFQIVKNEPPIAVVGDDLNAIMGRKAGKFDSEQTLHDILKTIIYDLLPE